MSLSILIPLVLLPVLVLGAYAWYRRAMNRMKPDDGERDVSGLRLTSERLRALPSPPWRVVYEIRGDSLGSVDHVVIGPAGVVAIDTVLADRPSGPISSDPNVVAAAAVSRGGVDELAQRAGLRCDVLAKVFWGTPQPDDPPANELTHASIGVEGQRLDSWLASLPAETLTPSQVDLAWQAIVTGIGRPDPLA